MKYMLVKLITPIVATFIWVLLITTIGQKNSFQLQWNFMISKNTQRPSILEHRAIAGTLVAVLNVGFHGFVRQRSGRSDGPLRAEFGHIADDSNRRLVMLPTNGGQSDQALVDSSKASGAT